MTAEPQKPQQTEMFEQGEDLPLFSGTPVAVTSQEFTPRPAPTEKQGALL